MIRQDFHIHTHLSSCSSDPRQTPANIHARAVELELEQICLTDHYWDSSMPGASDWYQSQNLEHIRKSISDIPNDEAGTMMFFGCETEYTGGNRIGISYEIAAELDFVLVPISHFHMKGFVRPVKVNTAEEVANLWMARYRELLGLNLPWERIGLAHVLDCCVADLQTDFLTHISRKSLREIFEETAEKGISVEINGGSLGNGVATEILREIYGQMKSCGCLFTLGSDAHQLDRLDRISNAIDFAETLGLDDDDLKVLI